MKAATTLCTLLALTACGTPNRPATDGATPPPPAPEAPVSARDGLLEAGLESPFVLTGGGGEAVLSVVLRPAPDTERAPVAMALVIDASGSMGGDKIEHARHAARSIIERLGDGDEVAVYEYDAAVRPVSPLVRADDLAKARITAQIAKIEPGSTTALFDGLVAGMRSLDPATADVRRVVLLSDGLANVGPSQAPDIIAGLPATARPVVLSTIGIGTDYDEKVMGAVARKGEGGFHHLTDPVQLAGILEEELRSARSVAGRDGVLTIRPNPGVEILPTRGVTIERDGDLVKLRLGALYAGEVRTLSLRVKVPTDGAQQQTLGAVALNYETRSGDPISRDATVRYVLTDSPERVRAGQVPTFMVAADRMRVAHVLIDAAALLEEGDLLEAQAIMRDERARLEKRRARLDGAALQEADVLIDMFRDPYVDAQIGKATAGAPPADMNALVQTIRKGEPVDEAALATLDAPSLRLLRNVAYARHGYRFKSADLSDYFRRSGWYRPDPSFDHRRLTPQDVRTVAAVKTWERSAKLSAGTRPTAAPQTPVDVDALLDRAARGEALDDGDLQGLDLADLRAVRNASYARHGYRFRSADLRQLFAAKPWYRADPAYDPSMLSHDDAANVQRVKRFEQTLVQAGGRDALRDFQLRNQSRAQRLQR